MRVYLLQRIVIAIPTLVLLTLATFGLTSAARGDAVVEALRQAGEEPSQADVEAYRHAIGLDAPFVTRYVSWLSDVLEGDLGTSILSREPVTEIIGPRILPTMLLGMSAFALATLGGLGLGVVLALNAGSRFDRWVSGATVLFGSVPSFWFALLLIMVLAEWARIVPVAGYGTSRHLVLPVVALALGPLAELSRLTRSGVLEVWQEDFVRTARAKGLSRRSAIVRHALPNALIPVVTVLGLRFGHLLGGAVVIETVFAWPGMGTALIAAISGRDLPVIGGYVLCIGAFFVLVTLITDVSYAWLDPRVRLGETTT